MKKSKEERIEEICEVLKNTPYPLSLKELIDETGLQRTTLIPYLTILEELNEVCSLEESSGTRFHRHQQEGLHPYRGRKQKLYQLKSKK